MSAERYLVVYESTDSGYSAYVPDVPGCIVAATSIEEAEQLMREALAFHFDGLDELGLPIPAPRARADYVAVEGTGVTPVGAAS